MREIVCDKGTIIVDDEDYNIVSARKWHVSRGYASSYVSGGEYIRLHNLILGEMEGMEVDHINRNGLDNRRSNLRFCSHKNNARNRGMNKNNTSGYKGVRKNNYCETYQAKIKVDGKWIHVGMFKEKIEAAKAYNEAARKYFGEYAYVNII